MSETGSSQQLNRNVLVIALLVTVLCAYQLLFTATETGNWRGAWFSLAHVVLVAVGSVFALREPR